MRFRPWVCVYQSLRRPSNNTKDRSEEARSATTQQVENDTTQRHDGRGHQQHPPTFDTTTTTTTSTAAEINFTLRCYLVHWYTTAPPPSPPILHPTTTNTSTTWCTSNVYSTIKSPHTSIASTAQNTAQLNIHEKQLHKSHMTLSRLQTYGTIAKSLASLYQVTPYSIQNKTAGMPIATSPLSAFLRNGWSSYWLRYAAHGNDPHVTCSNYTIEAVFVTDLLANKRIDLDQVAAACCSEQQLNLAKRNLL